MAAIAMYKNNKSQVVSWLALTFLFGAGFIAMEIYEFHHLIVEGMGPDRSGFLSAFFALVGTHGLHVTSGLIWMAVLMFRFRRGLTSTNRTRIMCLSLFWHFLDVVWICVLCCLSDGGDVMSHSNDHGASHGSVKSYMTGFILSII
jgi:cytochrome o ubiquinol oxidase subunit 3